MKNYLLLLCIIGTSFLSFAQSPNYDTTSVTVRLNFKLLDWEVVDDQDIISTSVNELLNSEGKEALSKLENPNYSIGDLEAHKIFSFLQTKDSLSVGRQGNVVSVPPFWATFNIEVPLGITYNSFLRSMNRLYPIVIYAHPKYYLEYADAPNDTLYDQQISLNDSIGINVDSAWNINTGENWVKVGVFDSGIDTSHVDLEILTGWSSFDSFSQTWGHDTNGHGTQVAGIIGARRNNTTGVAGIAGGNGSDTSGVNLIDFRDSGGVSDVEAWCASIINSSRAPYTYYNWGGGLTGLGIGDYYLNAPGYGVHVNNFSLIFQLGDLAKDDEPDPSTGIPPIINECFLCQEAFLFQLKNGVTCTASRGNLDVSSGSPYSFEGPKIYPSAFHDSWVMSIGSSGNNGERLIYPLNSNSQYFSAHGQDIDVIAPGSIDIVYTTESSETDPNPVPEYGPFSGTSAAAPHVAGVAALLISEYNKPCYSNINLDPADVEYIIQESATHTLENTGAGLYHSGSGHGRLNAYEALKMIEYPEYQIVHPEVPYISRQTLEQDTIVIYYNKPLNDHDNTAGLYGGPLGAGFPLQLFRPYQVVQYKEQLVYDFGQYIQDTTQLLDAWIRHSQTNSGIFMSDTTTVYDNMGGSLDSTIVADDFGIEQMAYIDSIVNDSLIYVTGYYYHFIRQYLLEDLQLIYYDNSNILVDYWYPTNPFSNEPKITYSIYIRDSTLAERYDFDCDSMNYLLDSVAIVQELDKHYSKVYPNPGSNILNIELDNGFGDKGQIQLFDAMGRLINEVRISNERKYTLNVERLNTGFYFIYLKDNNGVKETHKWIKR